LKGAKKASIVVWTKKLEIHFDASISSPRLNDKLASRKKLSYPWLGKFQRQRGLKRLKDFIGAMAKKPFYLCDFKEKKNRFLEKLWFVILRKVSV